MPADIISSTTQQFLDIHDIANNYVIMKDGTVSVLITVDAMNFGLLAEEEQDAVMYAYAGLLNSLNYPVQIVINSQTKDVTSYLQLLKDQESGASNETIRRRIRQYREFVGNLIQDRNVLDKKFYVVIPANSIELGFSGAKSVLPGSAKFDINSIERSILIEKAQNILDPRRDHMIAQFARIGLFSRQLTTQEIIQLFYIRYNPEATEGQQIGESSSYASPLVQASIQGNTMNTDQVVPPTLGTPPEPATDMLQQSAPAMDTQVPAAPTTWQPPVAPAQTVTTLGQESAPVGAAMPSATPAPEPAAQMMPPTTPMPAAPMAQPVMPGANATTVTASSAALPSSEVDIQADLNETVKQLGVTPSQMDAPAAVPQAASEIETPAPAMSAPSPTVPTDSDQTSPTINQAGDLPPLPEI